MKPKKKIAVFASGTGTNFINLNQNINHGKIVLLVSNNSKCGAVEYAIKNNINYKIINDFRYPIKKNKYKEYELVLKYYKPDLILLAGFMKKIPQNIIQLYNNKIMNVHPSLLPKYGGIGFFGLKVHEAVINAKENTTGVTIHFINNNYDEGPIILQDKVKVKEFDNPLALSRRVLKLEYKLYIKAVNLFCQDRINVNNNMVFII